MTTEQMLEQARAHVAEGVPADLTKAANENAAPATTAMHTAQHGVPTLTPQQHLHNAGIMYAKAGACFEGLYQQEVLQQAQAPSR